MIHNIFHQQGLGDLKTALEITWREQLQSQHNLVNGETPGFQVKHNDFRAMLLGDGQPRGPGFQLYLEAVEGPQPFDLERELRQISKATLTNAAYNRLLSRRYSDLRSAIREGR